MSPPTGGPRRPRGGEGTWARGSGGRGGVALPAGRGCRRTALGRAVAGARAAVRLAVLALAGLPGLGTGAAIGLEVPGGARMEARWVEPAAPPGEEAASPGLIPAMLTTPVAWRPGDPAAVLLGELPGAEPWRDRLAAELLESGVAVLELDVHTARGLSADSAFVPPAPAPEDLLPDLFGALRMLRGLPAGPVSAFGVPGLGGAAVLRAGEAAARRYLGPLAPRFAALALLDEDCVSAPDEATAAGPSTGTGAPGASPVRRASSWSGAPLIGTAALDCAVALVAPAAGGALRP